MRRAFISNSSASAWILAFCKSATCCSMQVLLGLERGGHVGVGQADGVEELHARHEVGHRLGVEQDLERRPCRRPVVRRGALGEDRGLEVVGLAGVLKVGLGDLDLVLHLREPVGSAVVLLRCDLELAVEGVELGVELVDPLLLLGKCGAKRLGLLGDRRLDGRVGVGGGAVGRGLGCGCGRRRLDRSHGSDRGDGGRSGSRRRGDVLTESGHSRQQHRRSDSERTRLPHMTCQSSLRSLPCLPRLRATRARNNKRTSPPDESIANYTHKSQVALAFASPQRYPNRLYADLSANAVPKHAKMADFTG